MTAHSVTVTIRVDTEPFARAMRSVRDTVHRSDLALRRMAAGVHYFALASAISVAGPEAHNAAVTDARDTYYTLIDAEEALP